MKSTQNEKISQIKFDSLVVGIDVGKETHYARSFDYRGIELAKLLKSSNSAEEFNRLEQWMHDICKQQDKGQVIVGFELLLVFPGGSLEEARTQVSNRKSIPC